MRIWRAWLMILVLFVLILFPASNAGAMQLIASWAPNTETNLAGYRFYWGTNYSAVANKQVTPITLGINQYCICFDVDENTTTVVYVGVSAYDTSNNESSLTIGYYLFGNITGDYNSGTPYTSARVDGFDLTTLGLYFGQTVSHPSYNCNDCAAIRALPLPTDAQKSDLYKDNRNDGFDLIELGLRFGNAAY